VKPLISIKNLNVWYKTKKVLNGISFDIEEGKTIGLVGESGCGKTTIGLSIMGLLPKDAKVYGTIEYKEKNILSFSQSELQKIRGSKISIIFQDPKSYLDPLFTVGNQIKETILSHQKLSKKEANNMTIELLKKVGIPKPEIRMNEYPHSFSGGMLQRVMIAQAISSNPELLIADEPTTALDVTIQAQILNLLHELKDEIGMSILLITHNFGIIAQMSDYVVVIYGGEVFEIGESIEIFDNPFHPYTKLLISSISKQIASFENGIFPRDEQISGCKFYIRCKEKIKDCKNIHPIMREVKRGHFVMCHRI